MRLVQLGTPIGVRLEMQTARNTQRPPINVQLPYACSEPDGTAYERRGFGMPAADAAIDACRESEIWCQ